MGTSRAVSAFIEVVLGVFVLAPSSTAQQTTRVSVDIAGVQGNGDSENVTASGDGVVLAFSSRASNLVAGDTNGVADIFVHDRTTGITERISVSTAGVAANGDCFEPAISVDGQTVAFYSIATTLVSGDTNGAADVFVHSRSTGVTERVSVDSSGVQGNGTSGYVPAISSDGMIVAFASKASNLVSGDTNGSGDIFVRDRAAGITQRASVDSTGKQANSGSFVASLSADGMVVGFESSASNLVAGDSNGHWDVFVHDRVGGATERISVSSSGSGGNGDSYSRGRNPLSSDGSVMSFGSLATNLVSSDTNGYQDVFLRDRSTATTEIVSIHSSGVQGDSYSVNSSVSRNGEVVVFSSEASNLVAADTNGERDIFIRDRVNGTTERVGVDSAGVQSNGYCHHSSISENGLIVAFESDATNLVSADTNGARDIFVRALCAVGASWSNYGAGWPGSFGVPAIVASGDPVLGADITVTIDNSSGSPTVGLLIIGFARASIPSGWGGTFLVAAPWVTSLVAIPTGGLAVTDTIPLDLSICGAEVDVQCIEADAGASKRISFTPGLSLILGG